MLTHTMPRSGRTLLSAVFSASRSEFMSAVIHQQKTQGQHGLRDSAALEVSSREGTRSSHVDSVVSTLVHPLGPVVMGTTQDAPRLAQSGPTMQVSSLGAGNGRPRARGAAMASSIVLVGAAERGRSIRLVISPV